MQPYKDSNRKEIYLDSRSFPSERDDLYDEQRRRSTPRRRELDQGRYEMRGSYHENRVYKGKWSQPDRYRRSLVPQYRVPQSGGTNDSDFEMFGLIFMCNKRTSRKCLEYNVLGMPLTKRNLAERVVPGMKLFLFEFESRELHGIFEAAGKPQIDLEPKAFADAEIAFPIQVRFRVIEKCAPLRECQFKEAIIGNYFEANRFKFNLSELQVTKLLDLFLPDETPHDGPRRSMYAPPRPEGSPYASLSRLSYEDREDRVYRRDDWKVEQELRKTGYIGSTGADRQLDYFSTNHHYLEYREPVSSVNCEPEYKVGKYQGLSTVVGDYGYTTVVDGMPAASSSMHTVGSSTAPYAVVPSKYETLATEYAVGRSEVTGLPEADRYWKAAAAPVQVAPEPHAVKQSVYARPPIYEAASNGHRLEQVEDVTLKKPLVSDVEYVQLPSLIQLGHPFSAVKELEYNGVAAYGSEFRRPAPLYPDHGVDLLSNKTARYGTSNGVALREESAYAVRTPVTIPASGTRVTDRYLPRELSSVSEPRYNSGPYLAGSYYRGERTSRYDYGGTAMNEYELQPVPKADYSVSGKYYADRGVYHRKLSVWDRVSGFPGPRNRFHRDYDFARGYKRIREMSQESQNDEFKAAAEDDGSFAFDFKRRNKNNESATFNSTFPRKRRFIRPGIQPQTSGN